MQLTSEQQQFILAHEHEDIRDTALHFVREDLPMLLTQIAGRQIVEKKIPSWYAKTTLFYPPHLSLEQSSSELTARYKASLLTREIGSLPGLDCVSPSINQQSLEEVHHCIDDSFIGVDTARNQLFDNGGHISDNSLRVIDASYEPPAAVKFGTFADLTGGMGVDFSFISACLREAVYVEQNETLCRIASYNFQQLGLNNATVRCCDAITFLNETAPLDFIYIDPSRRDDAGRKLYRIEDCSPDLSQLTPLLLEKSNRIMVKYSPMLDISLAVKTLGCVQAVHVVSVENECKELLFILSNSAVNEPSFTAVNLKKTGAKELFSFTMAQEREAVISLTADLGNYLYEPNASILKAGAFKSVAQVYSVRKLHANSHLYTSDRLVPDFGGRVFKIETYFVPNKKNIKSFLQETKKAHIAVRNFPMSVADVRRKSGLHDGGDIYLFATTLADEQKVWIVCRKVLAD